MKLGDHFRVRQALDMNVPRSRIDADDLSRPYHGIRSRRAPTTFGEHVDCFRQRMRRGQRFTGRTAVRIWGLPAPWIWRQDEPLEVQVDAHENPPRTAGVIGRRLAPGLAETWTVRGLPVVDPVAAVFSVAADLGVDEVVVLLDALVSDADDYPGLVRRPMSSIEDIKARLRRWGRFRGVRNVRAALPFVRERVESPKESETRMLIIRAGLPEPTVQHVAELADGTARLDLAYPTLRIAIEYEGDGHRTDKDQWRRDIRRQRRLEAQGWTVIRLSQLDLDDPGDLIARIRAAIAAARRR